MELINKIRYLGHSMIKGKKNEKQYIYFQVSFCKYGCTQFCFGISLRGLIKLCSRMYFLFLLLLFFIIIRAYFGIIIGVLAGNMYKALDIL